MKRSYLEKISDHLSEPAGGRARVDAKPARPPTEDLTRFYRLGLEAHRKGLALTDALRTESIWNELKSSSDREVEFFTAGLFGQEMPSLVVQALPHETTEPAPSRPEPEPLPVADLSAAPIMEPVQMQSAPVSLSTGDLEEELKLLKTLVNLLEQKLAQPVTIYNEFKTPRVRSEEQTIVRDEEGNMTKTLTDLKYEDE